MSLNLKVYEGELDDVDAIARGVSLRQEGKSAYDHEHDITSRFYSKPKDESTDKFLSDFYDNVIRGWHREDQRLAKEKYLAQLPAFQASLPDVGDDVYVEHTNNKGEYFFCRIEYITPEKDNVVIRYLDKPACYDQSNVTLVGYGFPGEFVKFHKEKPSSDVLPCLS